MSVFDKFKIGNTSYDVGAKGENIENGGNIINTFSQASSRTNIVSGEKASVIFGKIMKYFADLKEPAFKNLVENYETTVKGNPLDAIVAHMLKEYIDNQIAQINSNLTFWIDNGYLPDPSTEMVYLYDLGNEFELLTDGWGGFKTQGWTASSGYANYDGTKESTSLSIKGLGNNTNVGFNTVKKIDLSKYSKIHFSGNS